MRTCVVVVATFTAFSGVAIAQPLTLEWSAQLGDVSDEYVATVAADGTGGYYLGCGVGGDGFGGPAMNFSDIAVARVDATGSLLWVERYGTQGIEFIDSVASLGPAGFYLSGWTDGDLETGLRPNFGNNRDGFLMRFDGAGALVWQRQFYEAGPDLDVNVIAQPDGGALVVHQGPGDPSTIRVRRFDAAGNQVWTTAHGATGFSDRVGGIAAGPAGSTYVTGGTYGSFGGNTHAGSEDAYVMRLDQAGQLMWARFIGTPSPDRGLEVVLGPDGGAYVLGAIGVSVGLSITGGPYWIARYDPDGTLVWKHDLNHGPDGFNYRGMTTLSGGKFVISGVDDRSLYAPASGYSDFWIAVYNPDGTPGPAIQFGSPFMEIGAQIVGSASDRILLVGGTEGVLGGPNLGRKDLYLAEFSMGCRPDLTTGAAPGTPGYGTPNGVLNNDDFFYYLAQFAAGNAGVADLTTTSAPGSVGYGMPNGVVNNDDFFYYLAIFAAGC